MYQSDKPTPEYALLRQGWFPVVPFASILDCCSKAGSLLRYPGSWGAATVSIRVMAWAWSTRLPPMPKLVLMALADDADDNGFCFPSQRRLAWKCTISERTARRMVSLLASKSYVTIEPRFSKDRSRTSNAYRLAVGNPPDKLSGGPRTRVTGGPGHGCPGAPDTGVRVTTTYPSFNPKPQPGVKTSIRPDLRPDDEGTSCRHGGDLWFPEGLTPALRRDISDRLALVDRPTAQQLLDELTGRMRAAKVKNPAGYCAALVNRWKRGEFAPELALAIAAERLAARQPEARASASSSAAPAPAPAWLNDALATSLPSRTRASLERLRSKLEAQSSNEPIRCALRPQESADGSSEP